MGKPQSSDDEAPAIRRKRFIDEICDRFEVGLKRKQRPHIEDHFATCEEPTRSMLLRELLLIEICYRRQQGQIPTALEYENRFPSHVSVIAGVFPHDKRSETNDLPGRLALEGDESPGVVDRYEILGELGKGGFGTVYLGYDATLRRKVAIKVPHRQWTEHEGDAASLLAEAQILAGLKHPNVVPVYDAGQLDDARVFFVSEYVEGPNLAELMNQRGFAFDEIAELLAIIAETLHYAHSQNVVHRDVKPENILIDRNNQPHVADFGLAFKDEDISREPSLCGTPRYMSPEQARGEGHLVDHRSDIFSLGVVCYEWLTGEPPFQASSRDHLMHLISTSAARAPRQLNGTIPRELERVCLKALSKRAADRYRTALEMAVDLRYYLARATSNTTDIVASDTVRFSRTLKSRRTVGGRDFSPTTFVPRGLRSFEEADADFFLDLLPGPRNRDGIPESVSFWQERIEQADVEKSFRVGVIYGPSGCGKSSFVKAGLLPLLEGRIESVYLSANGTNDEDRLLNDLRRRFPDVTPKLDLQNTLAAMRQGIGQAPGTKTLILLDQFEQWLHGNHQQDDAELIRSLRQCDGGNLQCLVLVRDDFWMALTRFMQALEVPILEDDNSAAVDLFDPFHGRQVLWRFGNSYGRLPDRADELSKQQEAFLDQAISGLTDDGRIIPIRLALFAEMIRGKPWIPSTLKEYGGTDGVTMSFLESTFHAPSAPIEHRRHERAARAVLKVLLPDSGVNIKGHTKSYNELLVASAYENRSQEFDKLLRVLDTETRLLTPVDTNQTEESSDNRGQSKAGAPDSRSYHLTHDHLVNPLRDWLTRKQRETRRGRAHLMLTERAELWNAKPENRRLPSTMEFLTIRRLTSRRDWSGPERKMMRVASRRLTVWACSVCMLLVVFGVIGRERYSSFRASLLVESLSTPTLLYAKVEDKNSIEPFSRYRRWVLPEVRELLRDEERETDKYLNAAIVCFFLEGSHIEQLRERALESSPDLLRWLQVALPKDKLEALGDTTLLELEDAENAPSRRLKAAGIVAGCAADQHREKCRKHGTLIVDQMLSEMIRNPSNSESWIQLLAPIKSMLSNSLAAVYKDHERSAGELYWATEILTQYGRDYPIGTLVDIVTHAEDEQFGAVFPLIQRDQTGAIATLQRMLERDHPSDTRPEAVIADSAANAAVALLRLDDDQAWSHLRHAPDPELRTRIIHKIAPLALDPRRLESKLRELKATDDSLRLALILALGEYPKQEKALIRYLLHLYENDANPGIHGAAEWLSRTWNENGELDVIRDQLATGIIKGDKRWYITKKTSRAKYPHTMVILKPTEPVDIGTRDNQAKAGDWENQVRVQIGRVFAIASKEVTIAQFQSFSPKHSHDPSSVHSVDCPVNSVAWRDAARYCNWLSEQENIPQDQWCFEIKGEDIWIPEDYLHRTGYRLPTSAEWEYACRAGAVTSRHYGSAQDLLEHYEWYNFSDYTGAGNPVKPISMPVGRLKPNDFGLFDMLGNAREWCYERDFVRETLPSPPKIVQDVEDVPKNRKVDDADQRSMRGGKFNDLPFHLRCAHGNKWPPWRKAEYLGFRVVRTLSSD